MVYSKIVNALAIVFIQLTPLVAQSKGGIETKILRRSGQKTMLGKAGNERRWLIIKLIGIFKQNGIGIGVIEIIGILVLVLMIVW